jgi:hypothetical protein
LIDNAIISLEWKNTFAGLVLFVFDRKAMTAHNKNSIAVIAVIRL